MQLLGMVQELNPLLVRLELRQETRISEYLAQEGRPGNGALLVLCSAVRASARRRNGRWPAAALRSRKGGPALLCSALPALAVVTRCRRGARAHPGPAGGRSPCCFPMKEGAGGGPLLYSDERGRRRRLTLLATTRGRRRRLPTRDGEGLLHFYHYNGWRSSDYHS